jgi:hypothetical protein
LKGDTLIARTPGPNRSQASRRRPTRRSIAGHSSASSSRIGADVELASLEVELVSVDQAHEPLQRVLGGRGVEAGEDVFEHAEIAAVGPT